ncbi:MAG: hypothetical protein WA821_05715, partial [Anaerolineales bacterium]
RSNRVENTLFTTEAQRLKENRFSGFEWGMGYGEHRFARKSPLKIRVLREIRVQNGFYSPNTKEPENLVAL